MADTPTGNDPDTNDHPQTIKNEPDARRNGSGGALFKEQQERAQEDVNEENTPASPLGDVQSALGDDAEAIARHAHGGRSMGDAIGGSAGRDVGYGTGGDTGDLGGGDPQKTGA